MASLPDGQSNRGLSSSHTLILLQDHRPPDDKKKPKEPMTRGAPIHPQSAALPAQLFRPLSLPLSSSPMIHGFLFGHISFVSYVTITT